MAGIRKTDRLLFRCRLERPFKTKSARLCDSFGTAINDSETLWFFVGSTAFLGGNELLETATIPAKASTANGAANKITARESHATIDDPRFEMPTLVTRTIQGLDSNFICCLGFKL